ncbi:MAG: hypothetical protein PF442_13025 [Desulfobulbaceae bacterium]|jgi:hypothetical protein|nr:hypothetical protein [Desulfobulbaceae bacterium]
MKLHTCVRPDHIFRIITHTPAYKVSNLREQTSISLLGLMDGREVDNQQNFPEHNIHVSASDKVYELANPFSFKGSTFINGSWADQQAACPETIHLPPQPEVSFSGNLNIQEQTELQPLFKKLPHAVLLSLATNSTDPRDLTCLAEIACDFSRDEQGNILGLLYRQSTPTRRAVIHNHNLYEAVANNPHLPDPYRQAMVLRPGAQGNSEIVGEYNEGTHVYEYLRSNSYIPWGHYAANMADDTIRYSLADLSQSDMQGLRHLYYQRTYCRMAADLGLPPLTAKKQATTAELEACRLTIQEALSQGASPTFDATLWGWNYGFDFAPSGYRLNASHQMIHQQFAMIPAATEHNSTFCCGDLIHDCCVRYKEETGHDFFTDYIGCIRNNVRMDGGTAESRLILFEDDYCMAFIPKAQTSQWEVQIMATCKAGNILELSTAGRASIDRAFYRLSKGLHKLGLKLMCTIEYSSRFTRNSNQRLIYSFLPKLPKSPGAFSESQLRWIMGHFPEDFAIALRRAIAS